QIAIIIGSQVHIPEVCLYFSNKIIQLWTTRTQVLRSAEPYAPIRCGRAEQCRGREAVTGHGRAP
ncbi:hypothetical protein DFQ27_009318, partial [Actinomortierella ambigua]